MPRAGSAAARNAAAKRLAAKRRRQAANRNPTPDAAFWNAERGAQIHQPMHVEVIPHMRVTGSRIVPGNVRTEPAPGRPTVVRGARVATRAPGTAPGYKPPVKKKKASSSSRQRA